MNARKSDSAKHWDDPDDAPELSDAFFSQGAKTVGGREVTDGEFRDAVRKARTRKIPVSIRLSPEVVEYFRSTGTGWQTRLDEALKAYVDAHR